MGEIVSALYAIIWEMMGSTHIGLNQVVSGENLQFYAFGLALVFTCLIVAIPIRACFSLVRWGLNVR